MSASHPALSTFYIVFAILLLLLGATVLASQIDLGTGNFLVAVGIAGVKAVLIVLYFMHVKYTLRLTWVAAASGFVWLGIMIGLTLSDYFTRDWPLTPPESLLGGPEYRLEPSIDPVQPGDGVTPRTPELPH